AAAAEQAVPALVAVVHLGAGQQIDVTVAVEVGDDQRVRGVDDRVERRTGQRTRAAAEPYADPRRASTRGRDVVDAVAVEVREHHVDHLAAGAVAEERVKRRRGGERRDVTDRSDGPEPASALTGLAQRLLLVARAAR